MTTMTQDQIDEAEAAVEAAVQSFDQWAVSVDAGYPPEDQEPDDGMAFPKPKTAADRQTDLIELAEWYRTHA